MEEVAQRVASSLISGYQPIEYKRLLRIVLPYLFYIFVLGKMN